MEKKNQPQTTVLRKRREDVNSLQRLGKETVIARTWCEMLISKISLDFCRNVQRPCNRPNGWGEKTELDNSTCDAKGSQKLWETKY